MLNYVGLPMCPANASDEVKAMCKTTASALRVAGVVELLETLLND